MYIWVVICVHTYIMALPLEIDRSNVDGTRETPAVRRGIIELMLLKYLPVLRDRAADWGSTLRKPRLVLHAARFSTHSRIHGLETPRPHKAK